MFGPGMWQCIHIVITTIPHCTHTVTKMDKESRLLAIGNRLLATLLKKLEFIWGLFELQNPVVIFHYL